MLNTRQWIGAKVESPRGTPATLSAADYAILAFDPELQNTVEMEGRAASHLGGGEMGASPGPMIGTARITVELRGSGTAETLPVWASTLLMACGFIPDDEDGHILLRNDNLVTQTTVTIEKITNGRRQRIYGAMGNVVFRGDYGKRLMAEFNFTGIWDATADAAAPGSITHETTAPLRAAGMTFTVATVATRWNNFELNLNNQVEMRPDATHASGVAHAVLQLMPPTCTFDPEASLVATLDAYGQFLAGASAALAVTAGSVAGNQIVMAVPRLQRREIVEQKERAITRDRTTYAALALLGADELTISFP